MKSSKPNDLLINKHLIKMTTNLIPYSLLKMFPLVIVLLLSTFFSTPVDALGGRRPSISSFSPTERAELRDMMMVYLSTTGAVASHSTTPGIHNYNEYFLSWHRGYIQGMEAYLLTQDGGSKYVPLPKWDPTTSIPNEFYNGTSVLPGRPLLTNQNPNSTGWYDFTRFNSVPSICNYTSGTFNYGCGSRTGSAIDQFANDLECEHNSVHVAIGGSMGGTTNAPAAAIFWLWHSYIDDVYWDYQCECQGLLPSPPIPAKDLYTKDTNSDYGDEPHTFYSYESPDIWVRRNQDVSLSTQYLTDATRHQNPEYIDPIFNDPNYVYVKVHNRGCEPMSGAKLRVYFTKAFAGAGPWPSHWNSYYIGPLLYGDQITDVTNPPMIPTLQPGESTVIEVPWYPLNPADFGETTSHVCLLSRIISTDDPMTYEPAGSINIADYTRENNNVAWKNVDVEDVFPGAIKLLGPVIVGGNLTPTQIKLKFNAPPAPNGIALMDIGEVRINMAPELYARWEEGGYQGYGIEPIGNNAIQLFQTDACIEGIQMNAEEIFKIEPGVFLNEQFDEKTTFNLRIEQIHTEETGQEIFDGGENYIINYGPPCLPFDLGEDITINPDECVQLNAYDAICNTCIYEWSPADGLSDPTAFAPKACPEETTIYSLLVIDEENGCEYRDEIIVSVDPCKVDTEGDVSVYTGQCVLIGNPNPDPNATYYWEPSDGLENPSDPYTKACVQGTSTYALVKIDGNGCQATETVTVNVLEPCEYVEEYLEIDAGECIPIGTDLMFMMMSVDWTSETEVIETPNMMMIDICPIQDAQYRLTIHDLMMDCSYHFVYNVTVNAPPSCLPPTDITSMVLSGNAARISWTAAADAVKYRVRYRPVGGVWTEVQTGGVETFRFLNGLTPNTTYQYQVKTNCTTLNSVWSSTYSFTTLMDICDYPASSTVTNITGTSARVSWSTNTGDEKYKVKYKAKVPGSVWNTDTYNTNVLNVINLTPNTTYKYKLKTKCAASWTNWSPNYEFTTATSLEEMNTLLRSSQDIQLYPNPVKDILNIVLPSENISELSINNINGQTVKTLRTENNELQVNIAVLPAGIYYVNVITTDQQSIIKKFVKTN